MPMVSGNVPVQRFRLPLGEASVDATVDKMVEMAMGQYGARSAKIRALAINIIRQAGIEQKDCYAQALALYNWVRDNIYYIKDPVNQETLLYPEETAFNSKASDCDDHVILLMALLAAIGIKSYPVVVGPEVKQYSHVYLHAVIPPGSPRMANAIIPMDPIMKDWPAGKEIPAARAKGKKLYESAQNYIGASMSGIGGYVKGPSYLDTENSNAEALLKPDRIDVHQDGTVANSTRVYQPVEGLDGMLGAVWNTDNPVQPDSAEMENPRGYKQMGPYGPITRLAAATNTYDLPGSPAAKLPQMPPGQAKAYERPMLHQHHGSPTMFNKARKTVTVSTSLRDRPTSVIRPGNLAPGGNGVRAAGVNLAVDKLKARPPVQLKPILRRGLHGMGDTLPGMGDGIMDTISKPIVWVPVVSFAAAFLLFKYFRRSNRKRA